MSKCKLESYSKEELQHIFDNCNSYKEVLIKLNYSPIANNYKTLHKYINLYNLDISHIENNRIKTISKKRTKEDFENEILNNKVYMKPSKILKNLIFYGYKNYCCEECGINEYNNKPITLELHHKDGNNMNNSLDNVKILCPNCHSQTDNFRFKGRKKH